MTIASLLASLPAWLGLISTGGFSVGAGFFLAGRFLNWLGGRVDKREEASERTAIRIDAGNDGLIEHLQEEIKRQAVQIDKLLERDERQDECIRLIEAELHRCREERATDQAEVARLRAMMQGYGDAKQEAQLALSADRAIDRKVAEIGEKLSGGKP